MKKILGIVILLLLFCSAAHALDGFEAVQCGSDIPKALLGKRSSDEPVAAIEGRHKALSLKDLGASEISDRLSAISWLICGNEFMLLEDNRSVVHDVLQFPPHSKSSPAFLGTCQVKGQKVPEIIVAVLDNKAGMENLPAKDAWKVDEKTAKFVKMPTDGLQCPRSGIITADGGL